MTSSTSESEAREWFYATSGAYYGDLMEKYGITKQVAQQWISNWVGPKPDFRNEKQKQKSEWYAMRALVKADREGYDAHVASGGKLTRAQWIAQTTRAALKPCD